MGGIEGHWKANTRAIRQCGDHLRLMDGDIGGRGEGQRGGRSIGEGRRGKEKRLRGGMRRSGGMRADEDSRGVKLGLASCHRREGQREIGLGRGEGRGVLVDGEEDEGTG